MEMKAGPSECVALIGDLVASRSASSRRAAQEALIQALAAANELVPSLQAPAPTIGDEFQSTHETLDQALLTALVVRLALPEGMDARVGIGAGTVEVVGRSEYGLTQDGPAWWNARDAIGQVEQRAGRQSGLRTWVHEGGTVNAYLMVRDHVVSGFDGRQRRLALGLIQGRTQRQLAESEGISPSAVSQSLRRSGALAVVDGLELVR
ncbi:SatD family protein [Aeromicrobium duanguangcaii]|uniref:SatD family protein n=1 Tax=Aeromicrobium duanguangcaii TaxID=2968086 RepID=UPI002016D2A4|nr:SatD family protein [Aeromicrobium duanguangcaii]MCL3839151.1 SatD family protein [Aeromicrobium duanguangcaii]